jgi:hypothetical protein
MFRKKISKFIVCTFLLILLSTITSKAALFGGCDQKFMDNQNDVFYLKIQLQRDLASNLPWVATALKGGFEECRKFFRADERLVIKEMEGGGAGWSSYSDLAKTNISKSEFCSWDGPFSKYGLGEAALRYCDVGKSFLANKSKYEICKSALNENNNDWVTTNDYAGDDASMYVQEALIRGLNVNECMQVIVKKEGAIKKSSSVSIERKLDQLKNLLDEGLISQRQYNEKTDEILSNF